MTLYVRNLWIKDLELPPQFLFFLLQEFLKILVEFPETFDGFLPFIGDPGASASLAARGKFDERFF